MYIALMMMMSPIISLLLFLIIATASSQTQSQTQTKPDALEPALSHENKLFCILQTNKNIPHHGHLSFNTKKHGEYTYISSSISSNEYSGDYYDIGNYGGSTNNEMKAQHHYSPKSYITRTDDSVSNNNNDDDDDDDGANHALHTITKQGVNKQCIQVSLYVTTSNNHSYHRFPRSLDEPYDLTRVDMNIGTNSFDDLGSENRHETNNELDTNGGDKDDSASKDTAASSARVRHKFQHVVDPAYQLDNDAQNLVLFLSALGYDVAGQAMQRGDVCNWNGISCSTLHNTRDLSESYRVVTEIFCPHCDLRGILSSGVVLPYLQVLDLSGNFLSGSIPYDFFVSFPMLKYVNLSSNQLIGEIPHLFVEHQHSIDRMMEINRGVIDSVKTTDLDQYTVAFSQLNQLLVDRNNLANDNLVYGRSVLTKLDLSRNQLIGTIPESLMKLSALENLNLGSNSLKGPLPSEVALPQLKFLILSHNSFRGEFDFNRVHCPCLELLDLNSNDFTGTLPQDERPFFYLKTLLVAANDFKGAVPEWTATMADVRLGDNCFSSQSMNMGLCSEGFFAPQGRSGYWGLCAACPSFDSKRLECIGQMTCPGQVYQYAEHSGGTAAASSAVGEQRNLSSQTEIMWHIHSVLGIPFDRQVDICKYHGIKCFQQQVVSVDLTARECGDDSLSDDENELENEDEEMSMCAIPSDIGNFMHLEYLRLRGFDGTIPIELGNLRKIKYLDIADNDLTGTIPRNLFKRLDILRQADLSDNVLSGTIPDSLFWHDRKLESLNLSDNQLTGSIPERISLLTSLKEFRMSNNQIGGKIPSFANLQKLEDLQLQQNYLKGTIPSWLSDNRSLKRIDLHDNYLTGSIPVPLARIAHLQILNLSINSFTGTFPRGVAAIPSLNQLDVSSNFLSGEIPSELGRNRRLSKLVLHSNMFTGTVPEALCKNTRLNRGTTLRYGCNGIVCAAGTYNEKQGYGMCKPCLYANDMPFLGSSRCEGLNEERALKYFYNFMGGEGWDAKWSSDDWTGYDDEYSDVCNWYGVTCGKDGSIVGLEFPLHTDAL